MNDIWVEIIKKQQEVINLMLCKLYRYSFFEFENKNEKRVEPMDKCLNCGEVFSPGTVIQKFCCEKCGKEYRRTHNMDDLYPSITFNCAKCGRTVVTEGGTKDKRSRFCCAECEKKYWRHPPNENDKHFCNYTEQQLKARENSPD